MIPRLAKSMSIALVLLAALTGCWDRRELNELAIAVAMGLDEAEGERYRVTVQLVNPSQIATKSASGMTTTPVSTYSAEGRSIFEALRKMNAMLDRKIYLAHLRVLIIGEKLARRGISGPIDFMSRSHELRTDFHIVVARKSKAESLLQILTPQEKIPANKLFESLRNTEKYWGATAQVTLDELIVDLQTKGKSLVLPGLFAKGEPEKGSAANQLKVTKTPAELQFDALAVFKEEKMQGWLSEEDSLGYNFTQDSVQSTVIPIECTGGVVDVELTKTKTQVKGALTGDGDPEIRIQVFAEASIGDSECRLDLSEPEVVRQIGRWTAEKIKETINGSVKTLQTRYQTDVFGFGEAMHRSEPGRWKRWRTDWDRHFRNLSVQTNVRVEIRRIGTIMEPIRGRVVK